MKILLASDSHGDDKVLQEIVLRHPDMDLYLHAGDSCSNPYAIKPFIAVKGNCDYDVNLLPSLKLGTPYGKLYIQHYPYFRDEQLHDETIKIYVHGHTHQRRFEKIQDVYFINPGSTTFPRDGKAPSYCIIKIDAHGVDCQFFDI